MEPAARGDGVLIRRNNNRLSGINQKLLGIGRQHQFSWEKVQGRNVYMSEELVHNRLIVNSTVLAMDLITVFVRQEFNSLVQPMFLNFNEVGRYLNDLWRYVMNKFNQFLDYFFNRMRPRALHGRDALPDADRFRYQIRGVSDNSDTEDLVSLGSSSIGNTASDNLKVLELEAELAKIKEDMSSVLDAKFADMQKTIKQQAQAQVDAIQTRMDEMMAQLKTANFVISSSIPQSVPNSNSIVTKGLPPPAPPLPSSLKTLNFGQDRTNLMESIRSTGGFSNSGLKPIRANTPTSKEIAKTSCWTSAKQVNSTKDPSKENASDGKVCGYDYRNELAAQLKKRREVIERNESGGFTELEDKPKKVIANPMISSLLTAIPMATSSPDSPRIVATKDFNTSYCTDEEEWA